MTRAFLSVLTLTVSHGRFCRPSPVPIEGHSHGIKAKKVKKTRAKKAAILFRLARLPVGRGVACTREIGIAEKNTQLSGSA